MPALLKNSYGRGQAYYIACRDTGAMSDALYEKRLSSLQIPTYHLPEGVSIHSREKYLFVENYNTHPVTVELPGSYRNVETRQLYTHTVDLAPLSVAVVCKE